MDVRQQEDGADADVEAMEADEESDVEPKRRFLPPKRTKIIPHRGPIPGARSDHTRTHQVRQP
jgi:hypothetical protein